MTNLQYLPSLKHFHVQLIFLFANLHINSTWQLTYILCYGYIQIAIYTLHRQHLTLNIAHNELIYCSTVESTAKFSILTTILPFIFL